jgi:hypothetical protein
MSLEDFKTVSQLFAWWATIVGVVFGLITLWVNIVRRRAELIIKIYERLLEEPLYSFYDKVRRRDTIDWQQYPRNERMLNACLTLFDEVAYLRPRWWWLLRWFGAARVWEYVASEVQYFASNESVWRYIEHRFQEGKRDGLRERTIPFTGFPELLSKIPRGYRKKGFPCVPPKYRDFYDQVTLSIMGKFMRILIRAYRWLCGFFTIKDSPLLQDAIRRNEEVLTNLPEDTREFQRSKATVDEHRHNQLLCVAQRGHRIQAVTAVLALLTFIVTAAALIIAICHH